MISRLGLATEKLPAQQPAIFILCNKLIGAIMLTQERLKEVLSYNPKTGIFTRKLSKGSSAKGSIVGSKMSNDYLLIGVDKRRYLAHRLAWLYIYGEFPRNQIDHKDHVRHHNWIGNLRDVTNRENGVNQSLNSRNTSGVMGVDYRKSTKKWRARIHSFGVSVLLGNYKCKFDAICARKSAEDRHNYHSDHGKILCK